MDENLLKRVNQWLEEHRQEIIDDLAGLVRIPSVSQADAEVKPYGQPCRDALQYMFDLGHRHGYATKNYDNYVGEIRFSEGEKTVGIWAHLDVVPVPNPAEWKYPPFDLTLVEDRYLIGRGVQDNKAPAIGVFHVMNCLRDLGVALRHSYSLYMGTSEETGMEDVRYFAAHYPCPDMSLVPDTGFPVCCAQRGSMMLDLSVPVSTGIRFDQGNNPSVTPERITATLEDGRTLTVQGHSALVQVGRENPSIVIDMLEALATALPADAAALRSLAALCAGDGSALGIARADALSGALCLAPTIMECVEGRLHIHVFGILPASLDTEDILPSAQAAAEASGVSVALTRMRKPCSFPVKHPVVELLTGVYNEVMGQNSRPFVMSGGNYAAYLPHAFGFGPGMPGREFPSHIFPEGHGDYHQCDESEDLEHIFNFMRVYAMSIAALEQNEALWQEDMSGNTQKYLAILEQSIRPALGCTEPIAAALAVARAKEALGAMPEQIQLRVSCNILKNAMGVGIPGTGMVGLEIAAALSCVAGQSSYGLEVLSAATPEDCVRAKALTEAGLVKVSLKDTDKKLYIEAELTAGDHTAVCVIEDAHTNIALVTLDGVVQLQQRAAASHPGGAGPFQMDVAGIYEFINSVDIGQLQFLHEAVTLNDAVAQEGLSRDYGMRVGRVLWGDRPEESLTLSEYVCSYTAAAADARMAGCTLPVMSTAGSGNQGISASLPVAAAARRLKIPEEKWLRAEAMSQLVTIHIKGHIGPLSPLCGCAIASAIGSACGVTYMMGGTLSHIHFAIKNMIADISGLICDGAKSSCALKIASSISSAMQCAQLALAGVSAGHLDGIIAADVEATIRNLGSLGSRGMERTDRVILDMMIAK